MICPTALETKKLPPFSEITSTITQTITPLDEKETSEVQIKLQSALNAYSTSKLQQLARPHSQAALQMCSQSLVFILFLVLEAGLTCSTFSVPILSCGSME